MILSQPQDRFSKGNRRVIFFIMSAEKTRNSPSSERTVSRRRSASAAHSTPTAFCTRSLSDSIQRAYFDLDPCHLLLLLFFLLGFLALYPSTAGIHNVLVVMLILFAFLTEKISFSPLIWLYGLLTVMSVVNHVLLIDETNGIPQNARTMPIIFLLMVACRACTLKGLFNHVVILNTLPIGFLLILGGIHFAPGRLENIYLTENVRTILFSFGFIVGLVLLLHRSSTKLSLLSFIFCAAFMLLGASRRHYIMMFLVVPAAILPFLKKFSLRSIVVGVILSVLVVGVVLPLSLKTQRDRFGEDFSWETHLRSLLSRDAADLPARDPSSRIRKEYAGITFSAVDDRWHGFGNGNCPYVFEEYGPWLAIYAGHPHSAGLDALITAGYPGLMLYLIVMGYLAWIFRKNPILRLCMIFLLLQLFLGSIFASKMLWPALAIAEREIQNRTRKPIYARTGASETAPTAHIGE